jgi:catechol 2,3-dioxygenase-like lactoylglutathione lyase family enzyme
MQWSLRFDHAVILVADLERAIADFDTLGFTVTPGGVHASGRSRNALIPFADGSYLELLAFNRSFLSRLFPFLGGRLSAVGGGDRRNPLEDRFRWRGRSGEGLIDFALLPRSLENDIEKMVREGIRTEGPVPGGRTRVDGEKVEWRLALPAPPELPFLCADQTERSLRVPGGEAAVHPNGVSGIAGITVAVESLETSSARYRALLGVEPDLVTGSRIGDGRGRIFRIDGAEIIVAAPGATTADLRQHLRRKGEGPYEVHLKVLDERPLPTFPEGLSHGARLKATRKALAAG